MEKEYIWSKSKNICLNITANEIDSVRKTTEETSTVRVYDNGFIGVAGQVGEADIKALEREAEKNLENHIEYPCLLSDRGNIDIDTRKPIVDEEHFLSVMRELLEKIKKAAPNFVFSNKIIYNENERKYKNSKGSDLSFAGNELDFGLVIKDKASANLMDIIYSTDMNRLDSDKVVEDIKILTESYQKYVDIESGKYKVILNSFSLLSPDIKEYIAELYMQKASRYSEKLGQRIFSEKINIAFDKSPETRLNVCFFDAEGEVADGYKSYLIKDGTLVGLLSNKKIAASFGLPQMMSSSSGYDDVPAYGLSGIRFEPTAKDIKEIVGDGKAIWAVIADGGDITSGGDYGTPVQLAFLIEKGKIVGKLPAVNISANILNAFGDDFCGATENVFLNCDDTCYLVMNMDVTKV